MEQDRSAGQPPALDPLTIERLSATTGPRIEILAALLLGVAAFLLIVGPAPLDPTNIAWLGQRDAATNYLGWAFFRASPWGWPPAANPAYGMDIAGSVMMADANPLLALPFKLLGPWLPEPFQYFGWWLFACFLLHALFARAIAARLTDYPEQRLAIAALFLFAPCFLIRIATPAVFHMTLCGQWQILAALWLYLSPALSMRVASWTGLLMIAALTHPYMLVMVGAIWFADLLRLLLAQVQPPTTVAAGGLMVLVATVVVASLSGVFWLQREEGGAGLSSYGEFGFGLFKANLLSPIDSQGWSWILPDLTSQSGEIEGFAFLGLGVLLLGLAALPLTGRVRLRIGWQHSPLLIILLGFAAFAVTPYVGLGPYAFDIWWPGSMIGLGNLFRSSGRFVWPLVYCATIAICWVAARGSSRRAGTAMLVVATLVQIVDSSAGWRGYAATFAQHGPNWPTRLTSPFWHEAGHRYRGVRLIVPRNQSPHYRDLAAWALASKMQTDIVYLARYDVAAFDRLTSKNAAALRAGTLARDTLWITSGISPEALESMPRAKRDLVAVIDGIGVYAPAPR